jgi:hypothetical protein
MKNALPYVLILLVAVVAVLLFTGDEATGPGYEPEYGSEAVPPAPAPGTGLTASGSAPAPREKAPRRTPHTPIDPKGIPRGEIEIVALDRLGEPIASRNLRVYVNPVGLKDWARRLGRADPESETWMFRKILAGEVEVHVYGEHVVDTRARARVEAGKRARKVVTVDRAGAIKYGVTGADGKPPAKVTLSLTDEEGKPVRAYYQTVSVKALTQPRFATSRAEGAEGMVFGIPPGRYRLRAENEINEWDEADVVITATRTEPVSLRLGR